MKRVLSAILLALWIVVSGFALSPGDFVYTPQGRFLITGNNLNTNSAFQDWTGWTAISSDGTGTPAELFNINANGYSEGVNSVVSLNTTAGQGMYYKFMPTDTGASYVVSFKMKGANLDNVRTRIPDDGNRIAANLVKVAGSSEGNYNYSLMPNEVIANTAEELTEQWQTFNYAIVGDGTSRIWFISFTGMATTIEIADLQITPAQQFADIRQRDAMLEKMKVYRDCYNWEESVLHLFNERYSILETVDEQSAQSELDERVTECEQFLDEFLHQNMDDYFVNDSADYLGVNSSGLNKQKVSNIGNWTCLPMGRTYWMQGSYPELGHYGGSTTWNFGEVNDPMGVYRLEEFHPGSYVFSIEGLAALREEDVSSSFAINEGLNPAYGIAYVVKVIDGIATDTIASAVKALKSATYTPFLITAKIEELGFYEIGFKAYCKDAYKTLKDGSTVFIKDARLNYVASNPKPYAVLSDNNTVLTFYYDDQKVTKNGMGMTLSTGGLPEWAANRRDITSVVFDSSFGEYHGLTNITNWFNCDNLTTMTGMEYWNTDSVTVMYDTFAGCSKLETLDLSHFNAANVTDMRFLFASCSSLKTIYVGDKWTTAQVQESESMFSGCYSLVGGSGTTYDANHTDHTYAHIDGGPSDPGYFTDIADTARVEKLNAPTIRFDGYDYMAIESDEQDAELYYTMTGRMLAAEETDFSNGFLSRYGGWKTWGNNMSYGDVSDGGLNDSRCLKLVSKENSTFESAQAGYRFSQALTQGDYYMLYFKARSESGRGQLQIYCQNDTLPDSRSTADTLTIGSELADYEVMVKIDNSNTNQFVLNFGGVADSYYIDNVQFGPVISDTTNQLRTRYVQPLELREGVNVKAVAMKQGKQDSEPTYYDYFYDGWNMLLRMWDEGMMIFDKVYGDPNVPLQFVENSRMMSEDIFHYMLDRRDHEHVDDSELLEMIDLLTRQVYEVEQMSKGFTIDGVCYHAVDSTQAEVIAPLDYYTKYKGAIEIPATVNFNDIDFQVTSVAQGAFADSELAAIVWHPAVALKDEDVAAIGNPNLLLYVNDAALAPQGVQNVVVGDFAKTIVLTDVSEGNGDFYCPREFKAEMITYSHEYRQQTEVGVARGWESIALPFTVQTIVHETNGEIAPFGSGASNKHFWLRRLGANGLVGAQQIEANVPYIISMPNSDAYSAEFNQAGRVTFSSQNVTVPVTELVPTAYNDSSIVMMPAMQRQDKSSSVWAINVGESRDKYFEGSVFERDYRVVRPFEAYTVHRGDGAAPRFVPIVDMADGGVTGIEDLTPSLSKGEGTWYDLSGRKLQQRPTQKGVYILDGRKTVVK